MKQKIILISISVLIALGLIISVFISLFYGLAMRAAGSPDCDKPTNSLIICKSDTYRNSFLVWCLITVILIAGVVFFTKFKSKQLKKNN